MGAICGLIGGFSELHISQILLLMIEPMSFRGSSIRKHSTEGMGLALIETETTDSSQQVFSNESGAILAVAEGEIYNYDEILEFLIQKGHKIVQGHWCDVIPHLYEECGCDFPAKLNGSFVISIYDSTNEKLLIARDHLGSHIAFYYHSEGVFLFSTTLKSLLKSKIFEPRIDPRSVNYYFSGTCIPHPFTMFDSVRSLRPGHTLIWQRGSLREHEYWPLGKLQEDYGRHEQDYMDEILALCINAILIRSRCADSSDLGAVMSGGVDSSLISASISRFRANDNPLKVFSITYGESAYDDSHLQAIMLDRFPLRGHNICLGSEMAINLIGQVVAHMDYPLNNASAMGTFLCMTLARENGIKYILDGEAVDELFCGGGGVVGEHLFGMIDRLPYKIRENTFGRISQNLQVQKTGRAAAIKRFCYRAVMPRFERMLTWLPAFDRATRMELLHNDFRTFVETEDVLTSGKSYLKNSRFNDALNLYQFAACKTYLCDDLLYKNERMASANQVINRTPFADYRLAELAFQIPAKYKLTGYTTKTAEKKLIYRKAIDGLIPNEILWRKKTRGFSQPTAVWLRSSMKTFVMDILLSREAKERGIWNEAIVERILCEHFSGAENRDRLIWGLVTLELWMRDLCRFLKQHSLSHAGSRCSLSGFDTH